MRDRLIELFKKTKYTPFPEMTIKSNLGNQFTDYALNCIVDNLLANGVIVPHNKGCIIAILTAISALADMVNQFGYSTTFRKKEAVCDGGLSALENAFWGLEYCGCKVNSNGTISLKNLFEFQEKIKKEIEKYDN